jgi:hypothetical protein
MMKGNCKSPAPECDNDYELLPGRWTFEIWYGDRKLGEQSFTVVAAQ